MKKHPHIMVVDDDRETLKMLNCTLKLEGYDVDIVADGGVALASMEEHMPDLVILDITMPEPDGFQVLSQIRQHSNIPVIMLTGRCEVTTVRDTLALGADDYVRKPFSTRELLARIQTKLRRVEQQVPVSRGDE